MNIIDELEWRGAINQQTDAEGLYKLVDQKSISLYCGIDPTGDSMHIGHLIPFMILKRFQLAGHHPVILIGGGTGAIGDPSGRTTERVLQTAEQVKHNADSLTAQMKKLFGEDGSFTMMNNYDWLSKISLLDFLRDYGKLFNINTMLAKDVVASRMETGISFTEFSYQILQSIDYKMLYEKCGVQLQIGGADQWGNITNCSCIGLTVVRYWLMTLSKERPLSLTSRTILRRIRTSASVSTKTLISIRSHNAGSAKIKMPSKTITGAVST